MPAKYEQLTVTNLGSGAVLDLMVDADQGESQQRFVERNSEITFAINANAATVDIEVFAGTRQVVSRSGIEAGATASVFPNLNEKAVSFFAAQGEKLRFLLRETGAVATTDINAIVATTFV